MTHSPRRSLGLRIASILFHAVCGRARTDSKASDRDEFTRALASTEEFFLRLRGSVDIQNKAVLDVGCGLGSTCVYAASRGAHTVVGIDKQAKWIDIANQIVAEQYPNLESTVHFAVSTEVTAVRPGTFDVVISKDSAEHYADPERTINSLATLLGPDGRLVIGFSPLWKAPNGGHINFMTQLPWAHLLFPEHVIMQERRRYFPNENCATFADLPGGLNKMTLARFSTIMRTTGLRCLYFRTNLSTRNPVLMRISRALAHIPGCREYFTWNVYGVWSR